MSLPEWLAGLRNQDLNMEGLLASGDLTLHPLSPVSSRSGVNVTLVFCACTQSTDQLKKYTDHLKKYTDHLKKYTIHLMKYTIHLNKYTIHLMKYTDHLKKYTIHLMKYTIT